MISWLANNYIEIVGALLSLIYLYLSIKQNIWLWPLGLISATLYVIVFYQSKFYADMGLNGYYILISIYGWITWSKSKKGETNNLLVTKLNLSKGAILTSISLIIFGILGYILDNYTDSPLPYWDALTTSVSITATWMLAKKILEHWILWIFVDLISLALYVKKGLYPTSILFLVYTAMALIGYIQWKQTIKAQHSV